MMFGCNVGGSVKNAGAYTLRLITRITRITPYAWPRRDHDSNDFHLAAAVAVVRDGFLQKRKAMDTMPSGSTRAVLEAEPLR